MGVFNTLFDFLIFNVLVLVVGIPKVPANIGSTSVSMVVSFTLNRKYVFKSQDTRTLKKFVLFIVITAIGLYVFQSIIIYLLGIRWPAPLIGVHNLTQAFNLPFSQDFVLANGSKAVATVVSMVWNYVMYDRIVFKKLVSTHE